LIVQIYTAVKGWKKLVIPAKLASWRRAVELLAVLAYVLVGFGKLPVWFLIPASLVVLFKMYCILFNRAG